MNKKLVLVGLAGLLSIFFCTHVVSANAAQDEGTASMAFLKNDSSTDRKAGGDQNFSGGQNNGFLKVNPEGNSGKQNPGFNPQNIQMDQNYKGDLQDQTRVKTAFSKADLGPGFEEEAADGSHFPKVMADAASKDASKAEIEMRKAGGTQQDFLKYQGGEGRDTIGSATSGAGAGKIRFESKGGEPLNPQPLPPGIYSPGNGGTVYSATGGSGTGKISRKAGGTQQEDSNSKSTATDDWEAH